MILAVCLNLALDVTYRVAALRLHETNRVDAVAARAGGKGVNVARVLAALGHDVMVTGLAGGLVGEEVRADLRAAGLADATMPIAGDTRRTVVAVDEEGGEPTGLYEPGPEVSAAEWDAFVAGFVALSVEAGAVALSGSLPRGLPADAYATLIRASRAPVLLDASGDALRHGIAAAPAIAKPNRDELAALTDEPDLAAAAQRVRADGPDVVVISAGADGLVAAAADGIHRAAPPEVVTGNPTGAGDAAAAALVAGLVAGTPWPERLADAAALSAAAVHAPVAGSFDADAYARYREPAA